MLTRPDRNFTTKALIEPNHIKCASLYISILIVRFGDLACTYTVDTPQAVRNELAALQQKFLGLFDKLSDNNASDDALSLSSSVAVNKQILEVILMLGNNRGNNATLMTCQINACYNTYAHDGTFCHKN